MENYYIKQGLSKKDLSTRKQELTKKLSVIGDLYEGNFPTKENMNAEQEKSILFHREGYDFSEQIYDLYSEIGAILEAEEQL